MTDFSRQTGLLSPDQIDCPVTIIGLGGIGSWTAFALAKCGYPSLEVWDDDVIKAANCPNQIWRPCDIGTPKVVAFQDFIREFSTTEVAAIWNRFTQNDTAHGIVIAAVDSMESRRVIWDRVVRNPAVPLYLDGRMARESGRVYTINPSSPAEASFYESTLYSDREASDVPCGERAIVHNVMILAGLIASQLKKYWRGQPFPHEILFELGSLQWIYRSHRGDVLAAT